jgi:hypothetical protein
MQSTAGKVAVALGAIAVAVVLFVVLSGGDDEPTSPQTPATQTETTPPPGETGAQGEQGSQRAEPVPVIRVRDGKPVGGVESLEFTAGERVRFIVRSDVADEVHVHGYNRSQDVQARGTVGFNFKATLEGVFEVELESRHEQIAELRVNPS